MTLPTTNAPETVFNVYDPKAEDRAVTDPPLLLPAPPWRKFEGDPPSEPRPRHAETREDDYTYICPPEAVRMVNAALLLRRPLLVTGNPGSGKSTLAYSIARKLGLGQVLRWNITSRSTLRDGLYSYDALQRLNDASLARTGNAEVTLPPAIDGYIRLGPLGTALLPEVTPRVLLIDELDKSDVDLPNDLLHVFEQGRFEIPELKRALDGDTKAKVLVEDSKDKSDTVKIQGVVECSAFPIVILTSNVEREFPPAFVRRCIRLHLNDPDQAGLEAIAQSHLKALLEGMDQKTRDTIYQEFLANRSKGGMVANDQLLNALYLVASVPQDQLPPEERDRLRKFLTAPLNRPVAMDSPGRTPSTND